MTIDQTANWFDFDAAGAIATGAGVMGGGGGAATGNAAANSGSSDTLFQAAEPSIWTLVWALMRPSEIHWRNWSAVIGPYSFWSAPIILYMA